MAHKTARLIFAVLFIITLFTFAGFNAYKEFTPLSAVLDSAAPVSLENLRQTISDVEQSINENLLGRMGFIESYAYVQVLLGKEESGNFERIKGKDNRWYYVQFYTQDLEQTQNYARRIQAMQEFTAPVGTKVIYINPPAVSMFGRDQIAAGLPVLDYSTMMDALLYYLQSYGVDYIDLRTSLPKHNIPYESWFFKTDHHWTSELAFAAFTDIVQYIDEKYSANLDPEGFYKDPENYGHITYPQSFFGSMGKHTGAVQSYFDDFTAIYPHYYGEFIVSRNGEIQTDHSVIGSIFYVSQLNVVDIYNSSMYNYYLKGPSALISIENTLVSEEPSLLIIGDSFFLPVTSFLAPMFGHIDFVWPLAEGSKTNIDDLLEKNEYDYIIVESYEGNLITDDMFGFFRNADKTEADIIEEITDKIQE
jgi:hypothetical protein